MHTLLKYLQSPFAVGYVDDFTVGGPEEVISNDIEYIFHKGIDLSLKRNVGKCEMTRYKHFSVTLCFALLFHYEASGTRIAWRANIASGKLDSMLHDCCADLSRALFKRSDRRVS